MSLPVLPDVQFISDRVAHWATDRPHDEAIAYNGRTFSWREWFDRIQRVAGALAERGIGKGGRVAFLDKNHPACLELSLAAQLCGATVALINWRLAPAELEYIIDDSGATTLFVGAEFLDHVEAIAEKLPQLADLVVVGGEGDQYEALVANATPAQPTVDRTPRDLWLIMYSSGTTGKPKGVMLSHHAILCNSRNAAKMLPIGAPGDRNLVAMPLFHAGGSVYALYGILAGAPTTILREPDPLAMFAAIAGGATHAFLVPAILAGALAGGERAVAALSGLRYLVYGAAPMPAVLLDAALAAWPDTNFVQVYGQTELAGFVSLLLPATHRSPGKLEHLRSVGTVAPGNEVRVVDPVTERDVEPGATGELWVRSEQQMIGYLNRPEATADTITEGGWLRTGDVGAIDEDGFIYIHDRLKDMIISGGENVYSLEVEQAIATHPAIAEVAVFGIPHPRWGESVTAAVAFRPGHTATPDEIVAHTKSLIAGYKAPQQVDTHAALPRNASGKLLKRVLRQPYWE